MKTPTSKFLVVEDNDLDVEKIVRGFKRRGIRNKIVHARNGCEALEILRGTKDRPPLTGPLIILLDLNMPKMNGHEFLRELRSDEKLSHLPVVILTTSGRAADVENAYRNHVSGYLIKPMEIDRMYDMLGAIKSYWDVCELPWGTGVSR